MLHIARREWTEILRQRVMMAVIVLLLLTIAALTLAALAIVELVTADPAALAGIAPNLPRGTDPYLFLEDTANVLVTLSNFLLFGQFLGIAAVLAGHTVLHDRQCGTLPFLLLAPVRRVELLGGKVLGAVAIPFIVFAAFSTVGMLVASMLRITGNFGELLPPSPGWLAAFWVSAPAWAAFTCTVCVIVSSVARDVRTAQQAVWFVMFFATLTLGFVLTATLPLGLLAQLGVAAVGLAATAGTLAAGSQIISRDLWR